MSSAERKYYGVASGMLGTMRWIGRAMTLGLVLLLLAVCVGRVQIKPDR